MFDRVDDVDTLDRLAVSLGWIAVGLAVVAFFVGVIGILSAPLYLVAAVLTIVAGLAARRRRTVSSPIDRPQYRDVLVALVIGAITLFALVATIDTLGILSRLGLFEFSVDARPVIILAHLVLSVGIALLAGAVQTTLGISDLERRFAPFWALWILGAATVGLWVWSTVIGLGWFEQTAFSRTRLEWVFYAGAGLLGTTLATFLVADLPGPFAAASRVTDRLDLKSRKRTTLAVVAALALVYGLLWFFINMTLSPVLEVALPGVDPLMVLLPAIIVPEVALAFLTIREVRREEGKPFYDRSMKFGVLGLSAAVAGIFAVLFALTETIDYLVFLILAATGPYGFYEFARIKHLRKMEDKLPDLLRDLAEYWKGGLSMTAAIDTLAKGEYGALTPEVRKMAVQISWGVKFADVLEMFSERVNTQLVNRAVSLIQEADRAGGKIADILMAAANDAREIKWLERERRSNMSVYVAIIYMSFGVFLAVIAIIAAQFLPAIVSATQSLGGTTSIGAVEIKELDRSFVVMLFFAASLVQSIGSGMVGGVMGEGEISAGLKHVFVMVLISYVAFRFIVGF